MKRIIVFLFLNIFIVLGSEIDAVRAVINSDVDGIGLLLEEGAYVNKGFGEQRETLLMYAIRDLAHHLTVQTDDSLFFNFGKASIDTGLGIGQTGIGLMMTVACGTLANVAVRCVDTTSVGAGVAGEAIFGSSWNPFSMVTHAWRNVPRVLNAGIAAGVVPADDRAQRVASERFSASGHEEVVAQIPNVIRRIMRDQSTSTALVFGILSLLGTYITYKGLKKSVSSGSAFFRGPVVWNNNRVAVQADRRIITMLVLHPDSDLSIESLQGKTAQDILHECMISFSEKPYAYDVLKDLDEWLTDIELVVDAHGREIGND